MLTFFCVPSSLLGTFVLVVVVGAHGSFAVLAIEVAVVVFVVLIVEVLVSAALVSAVVVLVLVAVVIAGPRLRKWLIWDAALVVVGVVVWDVFRVVVRIVVVRDLGVCFKRGPFVCESGGKLSLVEMATPVVEEPLWSRERCLKPRALVRRSWSMLKFF